MKTKIVIAAISFLVFFWSGPGPTSTSPGKVFGQEALSYVVIFADHNAGSAPLTVNFGANLTNPYGDQFPVTYEWDFGDGAASTKKSPQHTFTAAGTYTVTLQVTIWKSPKKVVEDTFTVTVIENLGLTIAADVSSGDVPHAVAFTSTVTGAVGNVAYLWEFGDETLSAEAEPSHTFNSLGTYPVTCTVTDSAIPPRTIQATTQIDVYAILELSIAADTQSGNVPLEVNFTSAVTGAAGTVNYVWEFGDESASTNAVNPGHTFNSPGTFLVTCTVTDSTVLRRSTQATIQIDVFDNLGVSIAADTQSGNVPLEVNFTSAVTGAAGTVNYVWEFGDESASTNAVNPTHTYDYAGTYPATCTVTDSAMPPRSAQATTQIDVFDILELSIAADTLSGNAPLTVNFTSTVTGAVGTVNYVWEFGDEATAAGAERSYTFNSPGTYPVTCTVTDSTDASRSAQASIDIEVTAGGDLAVCIEDNSQINVQIAPDGAGGAVIVWQDIRKGSDYDIYTQKLGSDRSLKWTANGVALCRLDGHQHSPQVAPDGAGGAIIVWQDYRGGDTSDIYAQRVDKDGKVLWATDGVAVCNAADNQSVPQIASDGAGGAIIVWQDNRNSVESKYDIYAQRLDMDGNPKWFLNGIPVCRAPNYQTLSQIAPDGAGGAFIAWMDFRSGSHYDIYAQQVDVDGNLKWSQGDKAVCTAANQQYYPQLIADGAGGAIVTWQDFRSGSHYDIYAMRVATIMDLTWPQNGVAVCTAADEQSYPQLVTDRAGGAIITWRDKRNTDNFDVYAQRVDGAGNMKWAENGLAVCTLPYDQSFPDLVSAGAGGAVVTWQDSRSGIETHNDVYAQSIDGDANFRWAENGLPVCVKPLHQSNPKITYYGTGGAIIVWIDSRTANWDIYAQRVNKDGNFE